MDIEEIEDRLGGEWLLPLGNGGYASGRLLGPRSRSYHGLFVAGLPAPQDRVLVLAQVDESLTTAAGATYLLAAHLYEDGSLHPHGDRHLIYAGRRGEVMVWRWKAGGIEIERSLRLGPGNRGRLTWTLLEGRPRRIAVRPFITFRSHHGGPGPVLGGEFQGQRVQVSFAGRPETLVLNSERGVARPDFVRHERILLADEQARGLGAIESLDSPGEFVWEAPEPATSMTLDFLLEDGLGASSPTAVRPPLPERSGLRARLDQAMTDFLVHGPEEGRAGLIAGYPWFNEWGRDSMIALPGLACALGDLRIPLEILEAWAQRLAGGLLPNRLAEGEGPPSFNSADAPLWFLRSAFRFGRQLGGLEALPAVVLCALREILLSYHEGTDHGIGVDPADGLLVAGDADTQLTWMDARFGDEAITPRWGKCVELQALYHEGLRSAVELGLGGAERERHGERAERLAQAFRRRFLGGPGGGLHDCVDGDRSLLRPNQFLALGSRYPLLSRDEGRRILGAIEGSLLTPMGPRSLAASEPGYRPRYRGGPEARDRSYHQGTVWAWLIGPWGDAVMASAADDGTARLRIETALASLALDLDRGLRGQIGEIFDGDPPHQGVGAPAQAWSVAEFVRLIEDHRLDAARIAWLGSELA